MRNFLFEARARGKAIAVVYIEGVIGDSERVVRKIRRVEKDDNFRALVLRINSPGGLVAPTWEIYTAIRELREIKPVVASIETIGTSGGYYVASAADKIIVTPGTITGSIGVIIRTLNLKKIFDRLGVKNVVIKSGKMKDTLASYREMTPEEKRYLRKIVHQMYERFLKDVAVGRGMNVRDIKPYADGRVITGEDAVRIGLVDEIGTFRDAVEEAKRLAGLKEEVPVIPLVERPSFVQRLLHSLSGKTLEDVINVISTGGMPGRYFAYLSPEFIIGGGGR